MQTLGRKDRPVGDELFDESAGYDDETGVRFAPGLTTAERQQATILYRLFNELWGVCAVKGDPGTGKDLFGNYIAHKIKRYFPWKRILRDERPRRLFGSYDALFNEAVIQSDLATMRKIAKGVRNDTGAQKYDGTYMAALERAADDWVKGAGEVMLKNSLLYLTEYWNYCYKREPHKPMNKVMGAIQKVKRHLDLLVIGTTQLIDDLDKWTAKPWIDWEVTCTRSATNKTGFVYYVQKVKYDKRMDLMVPLGRPFPISFDAGRPRAELGDGKIHIRKMEYRPETEEERIVLDVLKAGIDNFDGLVDILDTDGDMSEVEVLATVKELKFRKYKRVIDYPCFFGLYNSKSAPQIRTSLKVEE